MSTAHARRHRWVHHRLPGQDRGQSVPETLRCDLDFEELKQLTSAREVPIMETQNLRERVKTASTEKPGLETNGKAVEGHPGGDIKHGGPAEILRFLLMITYFLSSTCS